MGESSSVTALAGLNGGVRTYKRPHPDISEPPFTQQQPTLHGFLTMALHNPSAALSPTPVGKYLRISKGSKGCSLLKQFTASVR